MIEELKHATISYTGTSATVLFRDRDKTGSQIKSALSHRLGVPVQFVFQTSSQTRIEWWNQGILYNAFGPSTVVDDHIQHHEIHTQPSGSVGREGGPADITHKYQKSYREKWINKNGVVRRDDGGPAVTEIDYGSPAVVTWDSWMPKGDNKDLANYFNDDDLITPITRREFRWSPIRASSWSYQLDSDIAERIDVSRTYNIVRTTVVVTRELRWYDDDNRLHRPDGPAHMILTNVKEAEKDNKYGRWKYKGWTGAWHVHGREINDLDIIHWARKNHIRMWNDACYDKSAFRDAGDEFCFLTDFVGAMK